MRILNFGSLNLDYVYRVKHFVGPGETLSALSREVSPGGKGLNQSIALARAGARVCHAGCLGKDGEMLREILERNGVDTSLLQQVDEMQGHTVIQVDPEGGNCILLYGGSNRCVTEKQIDEPLSSFGPGDWLVLQNEINLPGKIVDRAYERGIRTILNPSPYDGKLEEVDFAKLSWVLVNEVEAEQMTGTQDPERAWEMMHRRWPALSAVGVAAVIGALIYVMKKPYPMDYDEAGKLLVDPNKMMNDFFKASGAFLGLIAGSYVERHCIHYEIPTGSKNLPILGFIGFLIAFSWKEYVAPATLVAAFGGHWAI